MRQPAIHASSSTAKRTSTKCIRNCSTANAYRREGVASVGDEHARLPYRSVAHRHALDKFACRAHGVRLRLLLAYGYRFKTETGTNVEMEIGLATESPQKCRLLATIVTLKISLVREAACSHSAVCLAVVRSLSCPAVSALKHYKKICYRGNVSDFLI